MEQQVVRCDNCKQLAHSFDIRYLPDGLDKMKRVCKDCYAELKEEPKKVLIKENKHVPRDSYFCKRCRYNFKHAQGIGIKLRCPGCGDTDEVAKVDQYQ